MRSCEGWTPFTALQIRYSLLDRTVERELLPMARSLDLAVTPWSVLGAGVLTGKYTRGKPPEAGRAKEGAATVERNLTIARVVDAVADEIGCTSSQVAIAWARQRPDLIIPILGARTLVQLEDNLAALDVSLDVGQLAMLDDASAIEMGFPHDFMAMENIRDLIFGGTYDRLDNHRPR